MKTRKSIDPYDQAAEILKEALLKMKASQIPDYEVPPVLADFALMIGVALLGSRGGEALIARMREELAAARHGDRGEKAQRCALRGEAARCGNV